MLSLTLVGLRLICRLALPLALALDIYGRIELPKSELSMAIPDMG